MRFKTFISQKTAQAKQGIQKAADTVKLYSEKNRLNDDLSELFETLGKLRYAEINENKLDDKETNILVDEIERVQKEIETIEAELKKLSAKKYCPNCENEVAKDTAYCPHCGTKLFEETDEDTAAESAVNENVTPSDGTNV